MPVLTKHPGVYIEELESAVRTITGGATSITAFVGRAPRGPVNDPIRINGFADYERTFGGLWSESTMGFALRDFFQNGGAEARVVRLFHPTFTTDQDRTDALAAATAVANVASAAAAVAGATAAAVATAARAEANAATNAGEPRHSAADAIAKAAEREAARTGATATSVAQAATSAIGNATPFSKARLAVDTLNLEAASEGDWGNKLSVALDYNVTPGNVNAFNLTIRDGVTQAQEVIRNVTVLSDDRPVDQVLEQESQLVRVWGALPNARPATGAYSVSGTGIASNGSELVAADYQGSEAAKTGIYALEKADRFNLLCIPPFTPSTDVATTLWTTAATYCKKRLAMLIVDPPSTWTTADAAASKLDADVGLVDENAALFFPRLIEPNPIAQDHLDSFAPCGAVAGIFARTDAQRGVWKAPAGLEATLIGVPKLTVFLSDADSGTLNPLGINCLRSMPPAGRVIWGSRTRKGDDRLANQWKYIPVRRLALYIEDSLFQGTQWVVFEPNDEPLWAQIRLNVGAFMHSLYRQGAFQGNTPALAYFVKCDKETTTQDDIDHGVVNILVGFAPLKPAEFVVIKITQMAGQLQT